MPWVAAGSNATLSLTAVDPIHLTIGNVLCSTTDLVPLVTTFTARIIIFDIQLPITAGTSVCNLESKEQKLDVDVRLIGRAFPPLSRCTCHIVETDLDN